MKEDTLEKIAGLLGIALLILEVVNEFIELMHHFQ